MRIQIFSISHTRNLICKTTPFPTITTQHNTNKRKQLYKSLLLQEQSDASRRAKQRFSPRKTSLTEISHIQFDYLISVH